MTETASNMDFGRRPIAISCTLTMLQTALLLLAPDVKAQSNACDLLKSELAARIEATGVRGYSLEAVPADTPVPPGAKAIGNCEAGASKILYRRWGASSPPPADAAATGPASAAQARVLTDKQATRPAVVQGARASSPAAASAAGSTPRRSVAASAPATPASAPERPAPLAGASDVAVGRTVDRAIAQPAAQAQPGGVTVAKAPLAQQASEFLAENWRWFLALIVLPVAGLIWAWYAYRSAYDEAGLPRGPKL